MAILAYEPPKQCRTVNGLIKAIKKGEKAVLTVYGVQPLDNGGMCLNLGNNKYTSVSKGEWELIKLHVKIKLG